MTTWTKPLTSEDIADIEEHVADTVRKATSKPLFDAQGNLNNVTREQVSQQLRQLHVVSTTHPPETDIWRDVAKRLNQTILDDIKATDESHKLRPHDLNFITSKEFVTTLPPGTPAEGHITAQVDRVTVDENGTVHVAMKPYEPPYEALTLEAAQRMQDHWAEHYPETAAWHTPTKKEWSTPTMTKIKSIADRWTAQLNWIKQFYEVIDILTELNCPPPVDRDPRKPDPATFGPYPTTAVGGAHLSWSHKDRQIAFVTQSSHPTKRSYGFRVGDRKWHSVTDPRQLRDACEEFVSDLNRYLAEIS